MNRKSLKELKKLIEKDIESCKNFTEDKNIKIDLNPQVVEMRLKNNARIDAMEDILIYIKNGEKYGFRKD